MSSNFLEEFDFKIDYFQGHKSEAISTICGQGIQYGGLYRFEKADLELLLISRKGEYLEARVTLLLDSFIFILVIFWRKRVWVIMMMMMGTIESKLCIAYHTRCIIADNYHNPFAPFNQFFSAILITSDQMDNYLLWNLYYQNLELSDGKIKLFSF